MTSELLIPRPPVALVKSAHKNASSTLLALTLLASSLCLAGPVADFNTEFRAAYADYRSALFTTNAKDVAAAAKSLDALAVKWRAIDARWGNTPPPQYAEDGQWGNTVKRVSQIIVEADRTIRAGNLPEAHEILERLRDEIGALNARNNIATFSDRMNAYHERMEKVLGGNYEGFSDSGRSRVREDLGVLEFLAGELERHAPKDTVSTPEFRANLQGLRDSLGALRTALAGSDSQAIGKAISGLKPAYSKFFLRFG